MRQAADLPIAVRGILAGDGSPLLVRRRSLPPPHFCRADLARASGACRREAEQPLRAARRRHRQGRSRRPPWSSQAQPATGGCSGLILDVVVEAGNPADAERFLPMLERHIARRDTPPGNGGGDVWERSCFHCLTAPFKGSARRYSVPVRDTQQLCSSIAPQTLLIEKR